MIRRPAETERYHDRPLHHLRGHNRQLAEKGRHARRGLEDNLRLDRGTLVPGNADLMRRAEEVCEQNDRPEPRWQQARAVLGLRQSGDTRKGQAE